MPPGTLAAVTLLAGAARGDISPDVSRPPGGAGGAGIPLMGYGARVGNASGIHDPLFARALCLADSEAPDSGVLVAAADLCLVTPTQANAVRDEIAERTGLARERILLSCTHTHSGPDTGLGALLTAREPPDYLRELFEGIVEAGARAYRALAPASARWARAQAFIGRNRRLAAGPVDPEVRILAVDDVQGRPIATLFNYACHGTVLGHDNLEISADWAGVACDEIERRRGGVGLFLLGAHADIDPRTRGLMDLAIDGQSIGLGFDAVRVLGCEVADATLAALEGSPQEPVARIDGSSAPVALPLHLGEGDEEAARAQLEARKAGLAEDLGVQRGAFPRLMELHALAAQRASGLPLPEARELIARVRLYVRDRSAPHWLGLGRGAPRRVDVEVQVLRIGDVFVLSLPLEPTTEVGLDWKRRSGGGCVAGIANGWLRYLPHPHDLAEPLAHHRYEVLSSILAPGACERLLATAEQLRETLIQ